MAPVQPVANVPMAVAPLYSAPTPQDAEVLKRFLLGAGKAALAGIQFPGDLMHDAARSLRAGRPAGVYADLVETARRVSRDPAAVPGMVVNALKAQAEQARSSPGAMAETMGGMLDVRNMLRRKPTMAELDVYHGTPHTFEPEEGAPLGRFRSSKIGTGEGKQMFGYGLYLAENKNVAKDYKVSLEKTNTLINGKPVFPGNPDFAAATQISVYGYDNALQKAINDSTAEWLTPEGRQQQLVHAERIRNLKDAKITEEKTGRVYKVDLPDAKIEQMLDWDKPLLEQPQLLDALRRSKNKTVQSVMAQIGDPSKPIMSYGQDLGLEDGQGLMRRLSYALDGKPNSPKASALLQKLGVPGVKYLDAGSRVGGKGTRNFVVFPGEEQHLNILSRD